MADNKKLRGKQDRAKIALNEPYEVNYFSESTTLRKSRRKRSSRIPRVTDRRRTKRLRN